MAEELRVYIEGSLHSAGGKGVVRMRARYRTAVGGVWSALTDPQRLAHWYGKVEGDLQVGGEFRASVLTRRFKKTPGQLATEE